MVTPDGAGLAGPGAPPAPDSTSALRVTPLVGGAGLRVVGEIDIETGPVLARALAGCVNGHDGIHLDLRDVTFVDVAGARVLVHAAGQLGTGHRLVLHHAPGPLLLVLGFFPGSGLEIDSDSRRRAGEG